MIRTSQQQPSTFVLQNNHGVRVTFLDYGARITGLWVPDKNGVSGNVVLHYTNPMAYLTDPYYLGCVIGRFANRIAGGRLVIANQPYALPINEPVHNNHLHGGTHGFDKRYWAVTETNAPHARALIFSYTSTHGEEGYPGTLTTTITYSLSDQNELTTTYTAHTDQPTIVSLTNHSYFNLSATVQDVRRHRLHIAATEYTPLNEQHIPTGSRLPVHNTPFDLLTEQSVGAFCDVVPNGQYCLGASGALRLAAQLTEPDSGRRLLLYTSAPALQVYGGMYLGEPFRPYGGLCLEPQAYANAPNEPNFPTALLSPHETYQQTTVYRFDTLTNSC